jgi:hypothetical protein
LFLNKGILEAKGRKKMKLVWQRLDALLFAVSSAA